jgi:NAD(P)-dependent dehydrogenase (short-subunit alcohol dehydrogenase family)
MSRIFITGSADGLGLMAAQLLLSQNHSVVLHARNAARAKQAQAAAPKAETTLIADLSSLAETKSLADQVNKLGPFDAIIHNAAVGLREQPTKTSDGLNHVFQINSLAPYILTALIHPPKRLVYVSSGLHRSASTSLDDLLWTKRPWNSSEAYSETKFHNVLLAFAIARLWPNVLSNAMEPGWVATKMGGPNATDDLDKGHRTQSWLATSEAPAAKVSGQYFFHEKPRDPAPATRDTTKQDAFLSQCQTLSGIPLPRPAAKSSAH